MKIACQIQYHGGYTSGWQEQPKDPSIASHLKQAIQLFSGENPGLACAGRTDKGVHALGQVVTFNTQVMRSVTRWKTGLNHFLPEFIRINKVSVMKDDFHPRFNALARTYRYYSVYGFSPHQTKIIANLSKEPNVDLMNQACKLILGEHDFSAFRGGSCQAKSPIKTCYNAAWTQRGAIYCFEIKANAFLHHMVRYLVGCMLEIGHENKDVRWFEAVLNNHLSQDFCASADGLYLCHAHYPDNFNLDFLDQRPWFDSLIA
jgi:tRNA pseudouridine38-40 synthase